MQIMYAELCNCGKCLLLQTIYSTYITDDDKSPHMWDEGDVTVSYSSSMMTASRRELKQLYAEDTVTLW
jgi:hypothetical protein